ncbi:MAG: oligosaccharide flippase family protein [Janthinobacterium lividum]
MSLRRGLVWMSLSQGGFFILQFGGSVVLARLLTPYEMGIYAFAAAVTGVLSAIQAFGLAGFIVREHDLNPDLLASTFTVNTALAVILAAAVASLSTFGSRFLHEAGVQHVMLVLALLPLLGALEFVPSTSLERHGQFKAISLVSLARMLASTATTVALAFAGFSYMSIAYGSLAGAIVSVASFNLVGRRHVSLRLSLSEWRRITRFGLQMMAISGVNAVSTRLAELLMGRLLGLSALGLYSRASSLNGLLWDNIHMVIGRVVFVDLAEVRRRGVSLRETYLRTVEMVTALLWPAFAGFAVLAGPLIQTVYGSKWIGAAVPLSLLSISAIVLVSITMTWEIFVVCEETGRQARFETFRTGVGLVLFVGGCLVSLNGAAAVRIAEALFAVVLYRPHLDRMTQTTAGDFVSIYLRSALLTAAAIGPSVAVMTACGWSAQTPIGYVLAAVAGGVLTWLLALRLMRHALSAELTKILAIVRRKIAASTAGIAKSGST